MSDQGRDTAIRRLQDWQLNSTKIDYEGYIGEITGLDYAHGEVYFYILQQKSLSFDEAISQLRERKVVVAEQMERIEEEEGNTLMGFKQDGTAYEAGDVELP